MEEMYEVANKFQLYQALYDVILICKGYIYI
jgi:hypothetical protein